MYRVQFEKCRVFANLCDELVVPPAAFVPLLPHAARRPGKVIAVPPIAARSSS